MPDDLKERASHEVPADVKSYTLNHEEHATRIQINFTTRAFFCRGISEIPKVGGNPILEARIQKAGIVQCTFKLSAHSVKEQWVMAQKVAGWIDPK